MIRLFSVNFLQILMRTDFRNRKQGVSSGVSSGPCSWEAEQCTVGHRRGLCVLGAEDKHFQVGCGFLMEAQLGGQGNC